MVRMQRQRWYNADGQSQIKRRAMAQSGGVKRVMALALLLALVVMCMMQLQDQKVYEPTFRAIGLAPPLKLPEPVQALDSAAPPTNIENTQISATNETELEQNLQTAWLQIWSSMLQQTPADQFNTLIADRFAPVRPVVSKTDQRNGTVVELRKAWLNLVDAKLEQWNKVEDQLPQPDPALSSFEMRWTTWKEDASDKALQTFTQSLDVALDARLLDNFVDASAWRSGESIAFARTLQRATAVTQKLENLDRANQAAWISQLPLVDVPLLTKQSRAVRGRLVRVRGFVRRADAKPIVKLTSLGEQYYHVLWLKPEQGSNVPICVYLVARTQDALNPLAINDDHVVEFATIPIKRLAYASAGGVQIAPVSVGVSYVKSIDNRKTLSNNDANLQLVDEQTSIPLFNDKLFKADPFLNYNIRDYAVEHQPWKSPSERTAIQRVIDDLIAKPLAKIIDDSELMNELKSAATITEVQAGALAQLTNGLKRSSKLLSQAGQSKLELVGATFGSLGAIVESIEAVKLPQRVASGLNQQSLYLLKLREFNADTVASPLQAIVQNVPFQWLNAEILRQPIKLDGLQLNDSQLWIADQAHWSCPPDTPVASIESYQPPIASDMIPLMQQGWDLSWNDQIAAKQKMTLTDQESDAFYSLINLTSSKKSASEGPDKSVAPKSMTVSIFDCLKDPHKRVLQNVSGKIRTVRVTRIGLDQPAQQALIGDKQYFEVNALVDIGRQSIRMVSDVKEEPIVFNGEFPITIIIRDLPQELLPTSPDQTLVSDSDGNSNSESWYVSQPMQFEGRFFRLWTFESQQTDSVNRDSARQVAPLVVASSLTYLPENQSGLSQNIINVTFTIIGVLVIVAIATARFLGKSK